MLLTDQRTFDKYTTAVKIDIIVTSTALYEEKAFSWALYSDGNLIMHNQAKTPIRLLFPVTYIV